MGFIGEPYEVDINFTHINQLTHFKVFSLLRSCICDTLTALYFIRKQLQALSHYYLCSIVWESASSAARLMDFRRILLIITLIACTFWGVTTNRMHLTFSAKLSATLPVCSNLLNKKRIVFWSGHFLTLIFFKTSLNHRMIWPNRWYITVQ